MNIIVFFAVLIIDRVSKYIAVNSLEMHQQVDIISGLLWFNYTQNTGAAFSLFRGHVSILIIFTVAALLFVVYLWRSSNKEQKLFRCALAMLAAGAIGNLIDRVFYGYVIDFIQLPYFAVINFADIFLVFSVILIIWNMLFSKKRWLK